ncbi:hypothetical protein RJ640_014017, partial [Escallonia rubra]
GAHHQSQPSAHFSHQLVLCNPGVTCSRRHNRVAALNVSYMGLVGTIPPDIENISFLASLDIRNNSFSANLPKEMAHLCRLKELNLHYNEFNGGLPTETIITTDQYALLTFGAHIINLDPRHILATNWSSATPVCDWARVTYIRRHNRVAALNLSYMGLVGTIPPDIRNISFLASLDIRNNIFSGNLPKEVDRLHLLKEMNLDYNEFSGALP